MSSLLLEKDPVVSSVTFGVSDFAVRLEDGRTIAIPLSWYPRLLEATPEERAKYEVFAEGSAIEWPLVDEHVSVEGLLAGRKSGESATSLERWRKEMDRRRRENALHEPWGIQLPLPDWWPDEDAA